MRKPILIVVAIVLLGFLLLGMRGGEDGGIPVGEPETGTVEESMDAAGAGAEATAESAGDALEQAADEAAAAGREAMDSAGEAAGNAMDAISEAADKAAETVQGAADTVSDAAKEVMDAGSEAASDAGGELRDAADTAMASADSAMDSAQSSTGAALENAGGTAADVAEMSEAQLRELFTVDGFDYDKAVTYIEQSDLGFAAKEATKSALASVRDAPEQLAPVLEEARERLGL